MKEDYKHHEFRAEWVDDEHGPAIMLTQSDGYCEPQTVLVHPWQFRSVCEHFELLPTGDEQASRTIGTLTRRLLALAGRIGDLREYVATHSDHEHADLHVEMVMLNALGDLADEWAEELCPVSEQLPGAAPTQDAPETPRSNQKGPAKAKGAPGAKNGATAQGALI